MLGLCAEHARAQPIGKMAGPSPLKCSVDIGRGFRLHIPSQMLYGSCEHADVLFGLSNYGVVLNFPDESPGRWLGLGDRRDAQDKGIRISPDDPFPVSIRHVFAAAPVPAGDLNTMFGNLPQVWQLKQRQYADGKLMGWSNETRVVESSIKPLRQLSFYKRPNKPLPYEAHGTLYDRSLGELIQPEGADYDLLMDCDERIECDGRVQLNSNKIQYEFLMPYESVSHAGEVVAWINQMIGEWLAH